MHSSSCFKFNIVTNGHQIWANRLTACMLKVQFFLVESIAIGKPIRGGRGVDPYTVLLRDAIPAVFYLSQDTSILRGTITLRERRGSLGWRRSLDGEGGGGVDSSLYKPHQVGFWAFLEWKWVHTSSILPWSPVWFLRELGIIWTYLSCQFQMNKNEIEICDFELHLKIFLVCRLI